MKALRSAIRKIHRSRSKEGFNPRHVRRLRVEDDFIKLMASCPGVEKLSEKLYTTYKAVEYLQKANIAGHFIECGVYKGRHICVMAKTLQALGCATREIYLYDTFAGMTKPGAEDVRTGRGEEGADPIANWEAHQREDHNEIMCAGLDAVRDTVFKTGYPQERFHFIKGDIRETVPNEHHKEIALLRLDTDWYGLTKHELVHLYDKVVPGGVVIIDDYGGHEGARQAVDEFFEERGEFPLLFRTQKNERAMMKTA